MIGGIAYQSPFEVALGILFGVSAIFFVLTTILYGIGKIRDYFAQFKPPNSVDETLAEMANAANAAKAERRVKNG